MTEPDVAEAAWIREAKRWLADGRTLYSVLSSEEDAAVADIRQQYLILAKESHPDRVNTEQSLDDSLDTEAVFKEAGFAWSVLKDERKRQLYNELLKAKRASARHVNIWETVELDDMDFEEEEDEDGEMEMLHFHDCRCGGRFWLTEDDVELEVPQIQCDGCSLFIRIVYPS